MALIVRGLTEAQMLQEQKSLLGVHAALDKVRPLRGKGALLEYQAGWLYHLAWMFTHQGARILEIGTLRGYSASMLAMAAGQAQIITLNPCQAEANEARKRLAQYKNVTVLEECSWDYLAKDSGAWDMIFVDGDHKQVARDLPWFNRLLPGGLLFFHDYSPREARVPCVPVYEAIEAIRARGRAPDVELVDNDLVGMAGFYRQVGESW